MAGQEQTLERQTGRGRAVHPIHESSQDSRDKRPGAIADERQDGDRAAGLDRRHRWTFSDLSRALL